MFRAIRLSALAAPAYTVHSGPEDHVAEHGVSFHVFADDTQLYVQCRRDDVMSAVRRLENCIDDVSHWMLANRLKFNADKTELLWAGSRRGPAVLGSAGPSLQLKTETVMASDQVRVLGVTMSSDLSLEGPETGRQRRQRLCDVLLLASSAQTGPTFTRRGVCGHAGPRFRDVTRRLLPCHSRGGIQVYQRQAPASYECRCSRRHRHAEVRSRTHPLLHDELHWLDVPERVQYKLCATVHRCLQHKAPHYMEDCCILTTDTARR